MNPHYSGKPTQPPVYVCARRRRTFGASTCWVVPAYRVDRAMEEHVLDSLSRENLDMSLAVLVEIERGVTAEDRQWQLRLERARIDAERAQRQFDRVEPENRLVARTLEHKWNEALAQLENLNQEYAREREIKPLKLSEEQRQQVMRLAKDLSRIWHAETTSYRDRKELLGMLVKQVAISPIDVPERQAKIDVLWHTGKTTVVYAPRPHNARATKTPDATIEAVRSLANDHHDREIAEKLNESGFRTGMRRKLTQGAVSRIRHQYGIEKPGSDPAYAAKGGYLEGRYLSASAVAKRLNVGHQTVSYWREIGALPAIRKTPRGPWWYEITEEVMENLRRRIERNHRSPRGVYQKSVQRTHLGGEAE